MVRWCVVSRLSRFEQHRRLRSFAVVGSPAAVALAVGTALTAPVGSASAVRVAAYSPMTTLASTRRREVRPPIPRVSTLGASRSATLVSYCWTVELPGDAEQGTCADGTPGHPAHTLRWRPGVTIRVDLRLPAHRVQLQAARFGAAGNRSSRIVDVKVVRLGASGRRWMLRLPPQAKRDTDLLISAYFASGDVEADLGIRRG